MREDIPKTWFVFLRMEDVVQFVQRDILNFVSSVSFQELLLGRNVRVPLFLQKVNLKELLAELHEEIVQSHHVFLP